MKPDWNRIQKPRRKAVKITTPSPSSASVRRNSVVGCHWNWRGGATAAVGTSAPFEIDAMDSFFT